MRYVMRTHRRPVFVHEMNKILSHRRMCVLSCPLSIWGSHHTLPPFPYYLSFFGPFLMISTNYGIDGPSRENQLNKCNWTEKRFRSIRNVANGLVAKPYNPCFFFLNEPTVRPFQFTNIDLLSTMCRVHEIHARHIIAWKHIRARKLPFESIDFA